jgi:uncharacterized Zn finger protein
MREDARTRGRRLLAEGRLTILEARQGFVVALCKGDSGEIYEVRFDRDRWTCTPCPARTQCAHMYAAQLCTAPRWGQGAA